MMKQQKKRSAPVLLRRLEAVILVLVLLWMTAVTAGSPSFSAACSALSEALSLPLLRWELGDFSAPAGLSPAAAAALAQSPLLLSAQGDIEALRHGGETPETTAEAAPETPEIVPQTDEPPQEIPDNGVMARTLLPTDPKGYTVWGKVWISSTRDTPLGEADRVTPAFAPAQQEDGPQVLIVHTHGSEAYTPAQDLGVVWSGDHRSTDVRVSVVHVGDVVAQCLSDAGISVLHDRTLYDYPSYQGSYDRSLSAMERHLEEHPSIRFILDIHRDAIEDKAGNQYKAVAQIPDVGTAAQMSLVVGSDGSGLDHPQWRENLAFAAALQGRILDHYPELMRPVLLRKSRYNQHLTPQTLLLEVGAAGNAPEEAERSARLFAREYAELILGRDAG